MLIESCVRSEKVWWSHGHEHMAMVSSGDMALLAVRVLFQGQGQVQVQVQVPVPVPGSRF